jgi:hypothetical protein
MPKLSFSDAVPARGLVQVLEREHAEVCLSLRPTVASQLTDSEL